MSVELKEFIELGTTYINNEMNLQEQKQKYWPTENRTILLTITNPSGQIGLTLDENFKLVAGRVLNPTVEVKLNEDTFWAIITKKLGFAHAFFDGSVDMVGEHSLRDFVLINRIFHELIILSHALDDVV